MSRKDKPNQRSKKTSPLARDETLGSWKSIAKYMGRTVRTVQRWEKLEGLPVRRVRHEGGASVYAYKRDLDQWLTRKNLRIVDEKQERQSDSSDLPLAPESTVDSGDASRTDRFSVRSIPPYAWIITIVAVFALGILPWILGPGIEAPSVTPDAVVARSLTTNPGVERFPSLSPDGRQVVYVWEDENGQTDLYLRLVDADEYIQLTDDTLIEESPAWSPDGLSIAFFRRSELARRDLLIIPALGGNSRRIVTIDVPVKMDDARSFSTSLSWFPEGNWIAFNQFGGSPDTSEIVAMSLESGKTVPLTSPPDGVLDIAPAVSPDGSRLAFTRSTSAHIGTLHTVSIDLARTEPAQAMQLPSATPWDTDPVWTTDSRELIFSGGRWPKARLWRMPADGSVEPLPLAGTGMGGGSPTIAVADIPGQSAPVWRMVYSSVELDNDIWTVSLTNGRLDRFQGSSQRERFPAYAPDHSRIAFLSDRSGFREIWTAGSREEEPVQWTDLKSSYVWRPTWSPDGSRIAYTAEIQGSMKAFVQDRPLGGRRQLTPDEAADEDIAWSLDGTRIYSTSSNRHTEGHAIYALSLTDQPPRLISRISGRPLGENPFLNELLIHTIESGNGELAAVDLASGEVKPVSLQPGRRHSFVAGPDGIYFISVTDSGPEIHKWTFDSREEVSLIALAQEPEIGMSIDKAAQTAVMAFINVLRGDLMLAERLR